MVKNSIALRAIEDLPLGELKEVFIGQTAIAYSDGDAVNESLTTITDMCGFFVVLSLASLALPLLV